MGRMKSLFSEDEEELLRILKKRGRRGHMDLEDACAVADEAVKRDPEGY
jgi:hypothetical protein